MGLEEEGEVRPECLRLFEEVLKPALLKEVGKDKGREPRLPELQHTVNQLLRAVSDLDKVGEGVCRWRQSTQQQVSSTHLTSSPLISTYPQQTQLGYVKDSHVNEECPIEFK